MRLAATWGVVAQVKAPLAAIETFVAWHLQQGASEITLYFDDPEDPSAAALDRLGPRVTTVRCSQDYWLQTNGRRPLLKTIRQIANALRSYRSCRLDWLAHIDVDEFILPLHWRDGRPGSPTVTDHLAELGPDMQFQRLRPYEALSDPAGGPPTQFRCPPPAGPGRAATVRRVYAEDAVGLVDGMLSHSVGKTLSRTGIDGLTPRLHVPHVNGVGAEAGDFIRTMVLLHYHAVDREVWLTQVPYRTAVGAYSHRPARKRFFQTASPGRLAEFYQAVQMATPDLLARLTDEGLLLSGDPKLPAARDGMFGG